MKNHIQEIKKQFRLHFFYLIILCICVVTFILSSFKNSEQPDVIKNRQQVNNDSNQNGRIITGASIPDAAAPTQPDKEKAKELWRKNISSQYLNWYKSYDNSTNTIVILD